MHKLWLLSNAAGPAMLALVLVLTGCHKEGPVVAVKAEPQWRETNKESQVVRRRAEEGAALLRQADAVLEANGSVHFVSPEGTNRVTTLAEFETALTPVQHRGLAVILIPAAGYDRVTNQAAKASNILKQCGFRRVAVAVSGWGVTFPYSEP